MHISEKNLTFHHPKPPQTTSRKEKMIDKESENKNFEQGCLRKERVVSNINQAATEIDHVVATGNVKLAQIRKERIMHASADQGVSNNMIGSQSLIILEHHSDPPVFEEADLLVGHEREGEVNNSFSGNEQRVGSGMGRMESVEDNAAMRD